MHPGIICEPYPPGTCVYIDDFSDPGKRSLGLYRVTSWNRSIGSISGIRPGDRRPRYYYHMEAIGRHGRAGAPGPRVHPTWEPSYRLLLHWLSGDNIPPISLYEAA